MVFTAETMCETVKTKKIEKLETTEANLQTLLDRERSGNIRQIVNILTQYQKKG